MKIFYLCLVLLHYAAVESIVEFTFKAISLGHSGLLITWEPAKGYKFMFKEYRIKEKSDEEFEFSYYKNHSIEEEYYEFYETRYSDCLSLAGQFKIHSLNESTLYEIIIQQYDDEFRPKENGSIYAIEKPFLRRYTVKMRTRLKSTRAPAKPYLEYDNYILGDFNVDTMKIMRWYPCGPEQNCPSDQESGTHFGIRVRDPYNTKKRIEVVEEEFYSDFIAVFFWPGRMYEVVEYSINGAQKTYSDTQEIFIKPMFTMVHHVDVISLPDSSVLMSWKPSRHLHDAVVVVYKVNFSDHSQPNADREAPMIVNYAFIESVFKKLKDTKHEQIRISSLKFELMYNFIIIPTGTTDNTVSLGLEYRGRFQLQAYDDDLPIARPDFNYKFVKTEKGCNFIFKWLPCGQSHNCENTKPGSHYFFEISLEPKLEPKPEPTFAQSYKDHGIFEGVFDMDKEYYVHLTSSDGKNVSKPVIKHFKDCHEIKKHTSRGTDEL